MRQPKPQSSMPQYVYTYIPEKKLSPTTIRMATITVRLASTDKAIGTYAWSRAPRQDEIDYMVSELIREHGTRLAWNGRS